MDAVVCSAYYNVYERVCIIIILRFVATLLLTDDRKKENICTCYLHVYQSTLCYLSSMFFFCR